MGELYFNLLEKFLAFTEFIIYHRVRKSPQLIVSQFNPVHALLKIPLHIILPLNLGLQSGLFFTGDYIEYI